MFCHFLKLCCRIFSNTRAICGNTESEKRAMRGLKASTPVISIEGKLCFKSRNINY